MPAARGTKRTAAKAPTPAASTTSSAASKNKKKRGPFQLEIPKAPTARGRVLTCGQGDVGQLGLGEDVPETTRFKFVEALGEKIVDVKCGGMHTIALDSDGKVWTFGCNDEGALGRPTTGEASEGAPGRVALPAAAAAISAGDSHSAALLKNGDVYAWGAFRDSHGSMGLVAAGRGGAAKAAPERVPLPEPAAAACSGGDHLVILTTSGAVYSMGCGEQGQLGRLSQRSADRGARGGFGALLTPAKVPLKFPVSRAWAGYHATFALDAAGEKLYAWGLNNYGQLGISGEKRRVALYTPTLCDAFGDAAPPAAVAPGQHHTLALSRDGAVYAIGRCEYGRLGLGAGVDAAVMTAVPALRGRRCVGVAAGTSSSFAVTDAGEIYAWGMGSEGQLGSGKAEDEETPRAAASAGLAARRARAAAAGGQHAAVLAEDPNRVETESPTPEAEQTAAEAEVEAKEAEEEAPRPRKRQKVDEVSSTTSEVAQPQKVNGDEKKETAMEVDETDNTTQPEKKVTEKESTKTTNEVTKMEEDPQTEDEALTESSTQKNESANPETNTTEEKTPEKSLQPQEKTVKPQEKTIQPQEKTDAETAGTEVNGDKDAVVTA